MNSSDYTMTMGTTGWTYNNADGFWYCNTAIVAMEKTPVLISSCKPVEGKAPEGYNLSVEIIAESIQSEPANVVGTVWGYTPSGN